MVERAVVALRARVRDLEIITALGRQLCDDRRVADARAVVSAVLESLDDLVAGVYTPTMRFELADIQVEGCFDAPIVRLVGHLRAADPLNTTWGQAAFLCSFWLLFSSDCGSHELIVDVDHGRTA
jgi:hypothetical protein